MILLLLVRMLRLYLTLCSLTATCLYISTSELVISYSILLICLAAATVEETPFICNNDIFNFILTSPVAVTNSGTLSIDSLISLLYIFKWYTHYNHFISSYGVSSNDVFSMCYSKCHFDGTDSLWYMLNVANSGLPLENPLAF